MVKTINDLLEFEKVERIKTIDDIINHQRPINICVGDISGEIRYAKTADELYSQIGEFGDKVPTLKELMALRILSFQELVSNFPGLLEGKIEDYSAVRRAFIRDNLRFGIWKERLTSSTNMVRIGEGERGYLYFVDFFPDSCKDIARSIREKNISDGGLKYSQQAIDKIVSETKEGKKLSWQVYAENRGGNFSGTEWLDHPVFNSAVGDKRIMIDYVLALNTLRSLQFISQPNSGWCPREMKSGYGRPISLGFGADAFYPPNNTTTSHAVLLIKNEQK